MKTIKQCKSTKTTQKTAHDRTDALMRTGRECAYRLCSRELDDMRPDAKFCCKKHWRLEKKAKDEDVNGKDSKIKKHQPKPVVGDDGMVECGYRNCHFKFKRSKWKMFCCQSHRVMEFVIKKKESTTSCSPH